MSFFLTPLIVDAIVEVELVLATKRVNLSGFKFAEPE